MNHGVLERALERALAGDGPLPRAPLPAPGAEVVLVLPPDRAIGLALAPLLDRLALGGVHRGRLELVLAARDGDIATPAWAAELHDRHGVRIHRHDPAGARTFPLRLRDGGVIGVADALRECEALVLVARATAGSGAEPLTALLTPGLADVATRDACRAARSDGRSWGACAAEALGVELAVAFDEDPAGACAWVGGLAAVAGALARARGS